MGGMGRSGGIHPPPPPPFSRVKIFFPHKFRKQKIFVYE